MVNSKAGGLAWASPLCWLLAPHVSDRIRLEGD